MTVMSKQKQYEELYAYFLSYRDELRARNDYERTPEDPFYRVFRLSNKKLKAHKVMFSLVARKLAASMASPKMEDETLGEQWLMQNNSVYFFTVGSSDESYYLTALLNSLPLQSLANEPATPKGGVPWKQFPLWTVASLPLVNYSPENALSREIVKTGKMLCMAVEKGKKTDLLRRQLDLQIAKLYGLDETELARLEGHFEMMQGAVWRKPSELKEWIDIMDRTCRGL
jgi:hypothetical protein